MKAILPGIESGLRNLSNGKLNGDSLSIGFNQAIAVVDFTLMVDNHGIEHL